MKRKIEQQAQRGRRATREVKTGHGGIRDVEFTIQFLQLLNGGDLPDGPPAQHARRAAGPRSRRLPDRPGVPRPRRRLPLPAQGRAPPAAAVRPADAPAAGRAGRAAQAGPAHGLWRATTPRTCKPALRIPRSAVRTSPPQKHSPLDEPAGPTLDTRDLLIDPLDRFLHDYRDKTRLNRTILDHLLHQTFADSPTAAEPESDLILDPDPDDATIHGVLGRYGFRDVPAA